MEVTIFIGIDVSQQNNSVHVMDQLSNKLWQRSFANSLTGSHELVQYLNPKQVSCFKKSYSELPKTDPFKVPGSQRPVVREKSLSAFFVSQIFNHGSGFTIVYQLWCNCNRAGK